MLAAIMLALLAPSLAPAGEPTSSQPASAPLPKELTDVEINKRIQEHRTALATLTVLDATGAPLANQPVTIRQVRHKFLFGSNAFNVGACGQADLERAYRRQFAGLLNFATLPFYWGAYEPQEGRVGQGRLTEMAAWCKENQVRTKGHPLCWHQVVPKWLGDKPADQVEPLQFAGLIDTWDVVNESVSMHKSGTTNPIQALCVARGQVPLIQDAFARRGPPMPRPRSS